MFDFNVRIGGYKRSFGCRVTENGCIVLDESLDVAGYPKIKVKKKTIRLNRYVYEGAYGQIFKNMVVRHICDNPSCINPAHLLMGTIADNVADRVEGERSAVGENNGRAKLKEQNVRFIKKNNTLTVTQLAKMFSVSRKNVRLIKDGKIWRKIGTSKARDKAATGAASQIHEKVGL